ncbi:GIDE domain-containing protein [Spongiactinospora sp. 9N601]|uniref:GIDE domain-containing protein n=1 Tax=Spongiactinospora sp. 9N601 TaxID=3375149 RepID=UPI0037926A1B
MLIYRIAFIVAGLALIGWALYERYRQQVMAKTPTIGAGDVGSVIDPGREVVVEVHGTAAPGPAGPLRSPFTDTPCVWHRIRVTRRYTEWQRQKDGGRKRVTKEEEIFDTQSGTPFAVSDVSGRVPLHPGDKRPDGAARTINVYEGAHGPVGDRASALGVRLGRGEGSTQGNRFQEWVLREGDPVYALGAARQVDGVPSICAPATPPFIISTSSEAELRTRSRLTAALTSVGGALLLIGTAVWWIMAPSE